MRQLTLFRRRTYEPPRTRQLKVRLPDELHDKIVAAAVAHNISLNSELIRRLEASLAEDNRSPADEP